uniref:Putative secreted protein n=1 Tax=Anopheles triannulatus TaxID=58253 RepID=A0A2M4B5P3_9DIPT
MGGRLLLLLLLFVHPGAAGGGNVVADAQILRPFSSGQHYNHVRGTRHSSPHRQSAAALPAFLNSYTPVPGAVQDTPVRPCLVAR